MGSRNSLHTHDDIQNGLNNFKLITMQQLEKEIKNISVHKLSGIQHLSAYVLKLCFNILKEKLLVVMNKSLFQGYFPKMWRHATIIKKKSNVANNQMKYIIGGSHMHFK